MILLSSKKVLDKVCLKRRLPLLTQVNLGILKFHENTFIPAKNSKNRRLSEDDKQLNKEMSAIRIEIEHFNAKFKTFQIMSVPYRNRRKRFELRAELICAIINYEVNQIPNKSNKEKDKIKDEYQEINHIKYSVDFVNKELGIDLSIEIDKLIKQGEKPSVIAQIKKFQDQVNKDNEYREMMKNKKMDQER